MRPIHLYLGAVAHSQTNDFFGPTKARVLEAKIILFDLDNLLIEGSVRSFLTPLESANLAIEPFFLIFRRNLKV